MTIMSRTFRASRFARAAEANETADSAAWTGIAAAAAHIKVGDRVRVVARDRPIWRGREGEIIFDDRSNICPLFVRFGIGLFQQAWFDPSDLELVTEPAAAPTPRQAIVIATDNGVPCPAKHPYVHADRAAAITEAERLARVNPGKEFAVYERVAASVATEPRVSTTVEAA